MDANERAFYDEVFQVLRNFIEYGNYNGKQENAIKVLTKRFPDKPKQELADLFMTCCSAYLEAIQLIKENVSHYSQSENSDTLQVEKTFQKKYSVIPSQMLTWIIGWAYHWHIER